MDAMGSYTNNTLTSSPALHSAVTFQPQQSSASAKSAAVSTAPVPTESYAGSRSQDTALIDRRQSEALCRSTSSAPLNLESESVQASLASIKGASLTELRQTRQDLKAERTRLREGGTLREKAENFTQLQDVGSSLKAIEADKRAQRWEEVASQSKGELSSTYKNYFIHGKSGNEEMKNVVAIAEDLKDPQSARRLQVNEVQPLVRGEIWQTKMQKLEEVAQHPLGQDGRPVEVNAEYYELCSPEMIDKLSRASAGGANVKVLMDPGQLSRMSGTPDATSMASRLNTVRRLEEGSNGKAAVQFFANSEVLGGRDEIMHRKLLRVGDEVVFGGMNANSGSGENVDFGMTIKGSGAARFSEIFKQDASLSVGSSPQDIYGSHLSDLREQDKVVMQPRGVVDLLEAQLAGPAQPHEAYADRCQRVQAGAAELGLSVSDLVEMPGAENAAPSAAEELKWLQAGRGEAQLTDQGRALLADGLEKAIKGMNSSDNCTAMTDVSRPNAVGGGQETMAVGNTAEERQAMLLHAIDTAESSIKVSAFVLNEDVARLLVDKKNNMEAQGKGFNVQVVMDPGIYGYGGSPNESAYKYLEDSGVPVKWAVLDRSTPDHDRKVHAKLMITDQLMLAGSTNFSHKGLRDNWELSEITYFNGEEGQSTRQKAESDFNNLWNNESLAVNTNELANKKFGSVKGVEGHYLREGERTTVLRKYMRGITELEKNIGAEVENLRRTDPQLAAAGNEKIANGSAEGYAILEALGPERLTQIRQQTPAWQHLQSISEGRA